MRLRSKLMLALLATGLASVAMVGGLSYISLNHQVDSIRRQQAAEHFHGAMTAYLAKYGDWQTATASESFDGFVRSMESNAGAEHPSDMIERMPPEVDQRSQRRGPPEDMHGRGEGGPPDRPRGHEDERPPRRFGPPPPQADGNSGYGPPRQNEAGPPRDARRNDRSPPFHFILTDGDYRVLLGGGQFRLGDLLPEKFRATARPVVVNNRTVAFVSSDGVLTPTPQEQRYLAAMRSSLLAGVGAATVLALALGLLLSRGLSRSLGGLTRAVRAMQGGSLRQQVTVRGKDEVAQLGQAFNEMSADLARSHEELKASHQTILEQAEQLRELSIRDALTQLYNRRHFDEQANTLFNQAVRHKRPLTLVICDIDHFKRINDTYSHSMGDEVLRHVGSILRKHMRLSDLVARYGGEEFVMAFPETPGAHGAALCDKLRGMIENFPWHDIHPELKVTISMGVCADVASGSAESMLQKADTLLYRAKQTGRNRVCFA